MNENKNIIPHKGTVFKKDRVAIKGHRPAVLWFTGFSGSGKSTLSHAVEEALVQRSIHAYVLDGDNVRRGINRDLEFSETDRVENIRRIGEISRLFIDAGLIVLSAFISPYRRDRQMARSMVEPDEFIEIYVKCSLEACEKRDVKGLYKKARKGEISDFTGISAPYEAPEHPELTIDTETVSLEQGVSEILKYLGKNNYIDSQGRS